MRREPAPQQRPGGHLTTFARSLPATFHWQLWPHYDTFGGVSALGRHPGPPAQRCHGREATVLPWAAPALGGRRTAGGEGYERRGWYPAGASCGGGRHRAKDG